MPEELWPPLDEGDVPTIAALHLFSQIVGKVAAAVAPWRNHGWHLTLHLTPRGWRTEPLHLAGEAIELELDLHRHCLALASSVGAAGEIPLQDMSVADFHAATIAMLANAGHTVQIHGAPNEIDPPTPFAEDTAIRRYDGDSARRVWRALLSADRVLRLFRSSFLGKVSPVHFFWGSFDLAVTRFSGRPAPRHPGGIPHLPDAITREAYSHEVSSAGFWPGGAAGGAPIFYSYAYPAPEGFADARVSPAEARFDQALGEFVLPYDAVRLSADPGAALLDFLETTYAAAADLARWDRAALDCATGRPRMVRQV